MSTPACPELPLILVGPLLRLAQPQRLVLWLVGSQRLTLNLHVAVAAQEQQYPLQGERCQVLQIGERAFIHLLDVTLDEPLPYDVQVDYDLLVELPGQAAQGIKQWAPHLLYGSAPRANFVLRERLDHLLHGSCRKPHHPAADGLLCADQLLAEPHTPEQRPALLMLSGDQVYVDDVAGPMLHAIHQLIERLGLFGESLQGSIVANSDELYKHPASYYQRTELLPETPRNHGVHKRFFAGVKKPIFTSNSADNHLVTCAEMLAMYLLVWSPTPWRLLDDSLPELPANERVRYQQQLAPVKDFRAGLAQVARALAHLPTLMIFDDHDITDDWNLSAQWELTAYGHPFSKRIIGNALIAYLLCQGWGNQPQLFTELVAQAHSMLSSRDANNHLPRDAHDELINQLFSFHHWHYVLPTQPALVVLDTRTRRWRSEHKLSEPSGLMDWEALCEFQQELLDHPSAIIVSPAPMFGVKLIETVQKLFTWFGQPLMVDAENWMAHQGAAQVMLNIFRHSRTPGHYVILSGDVHYSFVYEVLIRQRKDGPHIWQITSSGLKNQFPKRLLDWFDRLNRWLYAPWSPLNWLTRRRAMQVTPLVPSRSQSGERLWNSAGLGQVYFDGQGLPRAIYQLNADGSPRVSFGTEREASPEASLLQSNQTPPSSG